MLRLKPLQGRITWTICRCLELWIPVLLCEEGFYLVDGYCLVEGVGADFFAAEGGEEGSAAEGLAEVAGYGADVGAFAAVDAEVDLRQVHWNNALRVVIKVALRTRATR